MKKTAIFLAFFLSGCSTQPGGSIVVKDAKDGVTIGVTVTPPTSQPSDR